MPKQLEQKDFLNQLGKDAFGEFGPEAKQIIYNAGLSNSQTSAGTTSVTSVFLLYLMGQRQLSLSQITELSDDRKKRYGKEFMDFLREHPVRGAEDVIPERKRDNMLQYGLLFDNGMDKLMSGHLESPKAENLDSPEKMAGYVTDTMEGLALKIAYFGNIAIERFTDPKNYDQAQRSAFYGGFGGIGAFNTAKAKYSFCAGLEIAFDPSMHDGMNDVQKSAIKSVAKDGMGSVSGRSLSAMVKNASKDDKACEKFSVKVIYMRKNGKDAQPDNLPADAQKVADEKISQTTKAQEKVGEEWDFHAESYENRRTELSARNEVKNTLRNAEEGDGFELAYQVLECMKKAKENPTSIESIAMRSEIENYLKGVFEDPKRSAAYYQGLIKRRTQLRAEAARDSLGDQSNIDDERYGMGEYADFKEDPEMKQAIGDMRAGAKYGDDLETYEKLLEQIPKEYKLQDENGIVEDYLKQQEEGVRKNYEYFKTMDFKAGDEQFGFELEEGHVKITEFSLEKLEERKPLIEKRKQEEADKQKQAELANDRKHVIDGIAKINESDRSVIYDESLSFNDPKHLGKSYTEQEMYSFQTEELEKNEAIFDEMFQSVIHDPQFSIENFSFVSNGSKKQINVETYVNGNLRREVEDQAVSYESQRRANFRQGRSNKNLKKPLFQDEESFDRQVELLTKTIILKEMKNASADLKYSYPDGQQIAITVPEVPQAYREQTAKLKAESDQKYQQAMEHLQNVSKLDFYKPAFCRKGQLFNLNTLKNEEASQAAFAFDKVFGSMVTEQNAMGADFPAGFTVKYKENGQEKEATVAKYYEQLRNLSPDATVFYETGYKAFIVHALVNGEPTITFRPYEMSPVPGVGAVLADVGKTVDLTKLKGLMSFEQAEKMIEEEAALKAQQQKELKEQEAREYADYLKRIEAENERKDKERKAKEEARELQERKKQFHLEDQKRRELEDEQNNDLNTISENLEQVRQLDIKKDLGPRELTGVRKPFPSYTDRFQVSDFIEGFRDPDVKKTVADALKNAGIAEPATESGARKMLLMYLMGTKAAEIDEMVQGKVPADADAVDKILALSKEQKKALGQQFIKDIQDHPTAGLLAGSAEKTQENIAWYGDMMSKGFLAVCSMKTEVVENGEKKRVEVPYPGADSFKNISTLKALKLTKFGFAVDMAEFYENQTADFLNFDNKVTAENPYGISKGNAFISKMTDGTTRTPVQVHWLHQNRKGMILSVGDVYKTIETTDQENPNQNKIKVLRIACAKEAADRLPGTLLLGTEAQDWNRGDEYRAFVTAPIEDSVLDELSKATEKDYGKELEKGNLFNENKKVGKAVTGAVEALRTRENIYYYLEFEKGNRKAVKEAFESDHSEIWGLSINAPERIGKALDPSELTEQELEDCEKVFNTMFASIRAQEDGFLRERRSYGQAENLLDISGKFIVDGVPVINAIEARFPLPAGKESNREEWNKRHRMAKAVILHALADPNAKVEYRPALTDPVERIFKDNLPVEIPHPEKDIAAIREQQKDYYKNHPEEVKAFADVVGKPELMGKQPDIPGLKRNSRKVVEPAAPQAKPSALQIPKKSSVLELYEKSLERFNTKRLSIFEQESGLHERVRRAAEGMIQIRHSENKALSQGLKERGSNREKFDFAVDWLATAQELYYSAQEYGKEKNPFTFAGADRYGGSKDLKLIAKKEIEVCLETIHTLSNEKLNVKAVTDQIAMDKFMRAQKILTEPEDETLDYARVNGGDKAAKEMMKDQLIDSLAAFSCHSLLEQGRDTNFFEAKKELKKDKALSRALDRYISAGNHSKAGLAEDLKDGLKGIGEKLGDLRALDEVKKVANIEKQKQQAQQKQGAQVGGLGPK